MSSPEVPHSVESESPEQDVRSSSSQMYLQAVQSQETQPSSVQNTRMASFRTQSVQVTSALPQTTMCPSIQESQTLQQSRRRDPSISTMMQPSRNPSRRRNPSISTMMQPSPNLQPSEDQHQTWWNQHLWDQQTRQLWNEATRPGHYIEDQFLQTDPFIGCRQSGSYPPYSLQTQGLYNTPMLPQLYPGGPPSTVHSQGQSSAPYFSSPHLNLSQQTNGTEDTNTVTHLRGPLLLSENITRNLTCRQMTEQTLLQAHHLGISQSPHTQVYSSVNRNVQPLGSELHLQQSQHHQTFHQWLPEPHISTAHSGSRTQDIEACSNQTMYQPPPQIAPQSMSQPRSKPEISNTHQGETSQYFIIHCQHGSYSEQKFLIFYFCFVVLSPINPAVSHPVHKPSWVSKENYTYYFSHKNTFCI